MNNFLLDLQIYAQPVAFTLLLVSGLKLFFSNRRWALAVFTVGMGLLFLSQMIMFGAYQIFPASNGPDGGLVPNATRENLVWFSMGLYGFGLLVGSLGFAFYSFNPFHRGARNNVA